jgi:beta-1,2-mannobiose phosphorylase / 1,2-beta-oligomannan phosphorylase
MRFAKRVFRIAGVPGIRAIERDRTRRGTPLPNQGIPMKTILLSFTSVVLILGTISEASEPNKAEAQTAAGWIKYEKNPVLGGKLGTCFDIAVLREDGKYRMWFSWRPKQSIALVESEDGLTWGEPTIVLGPNAKTGWENDINRPVVLKKGDSYHMWYTGQAGGKSWIGYATSPDGKTWKRASDKPVLSPEQPWEKVAVMCPHVLYDEMEKQYRMWYSGGEQYEPNAIGYATSPDGLKWTRHDKNPIFRPDPKNA